MGYCLFEEIGVVWVEVRIDKLGVVVNFGVGLVGCIVVVGVIEVSLSL